MVPFIFHRNKTVRYLLTVIMTTIALSMVFYLNPSLDMALSQHFFDGNDFPLRHNGLLQSLRQANVWGGGIIVAASLVLLFSPRLRLRLGVGLCDVLVPLTTYAIGVGVIVNSFLKETFGRARPRDTLGLGGEHPLSAAWEISQACATNCSFTSGEAAGAMAMLSVVYLIPSRWPLTLRITTAFLGGLAIVLSFNRILFGGHYLSDVVLSALIITIVMFSAELLAKQALSRALPQKRLIRPA